MNRTCTWPHDEMNVALDTLDCVNGNSLAGTDANDSSRHQA